MSTQIYYLLRSRLDGRYLTAHPDKSQLENENSGYLLVFSADYDALSYLNAHAPEDTANQFAVESVVSSQLGPLLQRWSLQGLGVVEEPRLPQVSFFKRS